MRFNDIVTALRSKENCATLIRKQGGLVFIQDLHSYVKSSQESVSILDLKTDKGIEIGEYLKKELKYLLDNYDNLPKLTAGSKRPKSWMK